MKFNKNRVSVLNFEDNSCTHQAWTSISWDNVFCGEGNFSGGCLLYLISTLSMTGIQSARFVQIGLASGRVQTGVTAFAEVSDLFVVSNFFVH